jgi:hypothetical protein
MLTGLTLAVLAACTADTPIEPDALVASAATVAANRVDDLVVTSVTDSTIDLRWTQVDDGTGRPAEYRVKYALPPIDWATATVGCQVKGRTIGAPISCRVSGLTAGTTYDFQLMSYRVKKGVWQGAVYSNIATGVTTSLSAAGTRAVTDLTVTSATTSALTVRWTQIDDGTGNPARYRVRYAAPPISWSTAALGCDTSLSGAQIGAAMSCTIGSLTAGATYDVQLMSYRLVNGAWQNTALSNVATGKVLTNADPVADLSVASVTDSSMTVRWTEVSNGDGGPASYRLRYASPAISWSSATEACSSPLAGTSIGAQRSCTVRGLAADAAYDVQVMSYRDANGTAEGAVLSNVASAHTDGATVQTVSGSGIWISPAEVAQLPTAGSAWTGLLAAANGSCGFVDLANQDQSNNVCIMAKALVFARTGVTSYRNDVIAALNQIVGGGTYSGRALALGRELGAYVVAADLIGLETFDPTLDASFRERLRTLRTTFTTDGPSSLVDCHERRPNNWGTHCGATRAAIAAYLGDSAELARTAQVFKGWVGDRASYAGFAYGDLSWQCDSTRPVGINPAGCLRSGNSIDGVLPDDQRRAGSYAWPPTQENYVWEALQGALAQALILHRAGYPVWDWEDRALLRAVRWLYDVNGYPATGDDEWLPHIVNRYYGTSFSATVPARAGKNFGWTDWTHQ